MKTVLITGASGFIGTAVSDQLESDGWRVIKLDHRSGDISVTTTWKDIPKADIVVHLAGKSYVPESWINPTAFMTTNLLGTSLALDYCRLHAAHLVFASTYVYGIPQSIPVTEDHPAQPNNPYALSKYLAEQLCVFSDQHQGTSSSILRLFNVFGHGQRDEFLIPTILAQINHGQNVRLKDIRPRRDYIYIDDVATAIVKACSLKGESHTLNIGSGYSHSVKDIVEAAQKVAGTNLPLISDDTPRPQEIPDVVADISKAKRLMNWQPAHTLEQGLAKIIRRGPHL